MRIAANKERRLGFVELASQQCVTVIDTAETVQATFCHLYHQEAIITRRKR